MNNFHFQPILDSWLLALFLICLVLFILVPEFFKNHRYKTLRICVATLAILSACMLVLKPFYESKATRNQYIILTENYSKHVLDSLQKTKWTFRIATTSNAPTRAHVLQSRADFQELDGQIAYILGQGLTPSQLSLIRQTNFTFIPSNRLEGITSLTIPNSIFVDEEITVYGTVSSPSSVTLTLGEAGNIADSTTLASGNNNFNLKYTPKLAGTQLVKLHSRNEKYRHTEQIPLVVQPQPVLKVLLLQSSPGFELRELKNYLAAKGHRICVRSQVSKEQFRYEYLNHEGISLNKLHPDILQKFDIVITDSETLEHLDKGEVTILRKAFDEGLGFLVTINSALSDLKESGKILSLDFSEYKYDTLSVKLAETGTIVLPIQPITIEEQQTLAVTGKSAGHVYSGYTTRGTGRTGFMLLQETYGLQLQGKNLAYASLWNGLLRKIARSKNLSATLQIKNDFPYYPHEMLTANLIANYFPIVLKNDQIQIPLLEDVLIDDVHTGTWWAGSPGWHQLMTNDSISYPYYVADTSEWKSLRIANQQKELMAMAKGGSGNGDNLHVLNQKAIPNWVFCLVFLLSMGFLWLAPKL